MSRYQTRLPNGRILAWGYDYPLSEYFLTEFRTAKESEKIEKANVELEEQLKSDKISVGVFRANWQDEEVVFNIGSHTTLARHPGFPNQDDFSNTEIMELMDKYPKGTIPTEHLVAIAGDLTF